MGKKKSKKKNKKLRIFILVVGFLALLFFSLALLCTKVLDIKTKAIVIHGNDIITDNEVLESANLIDYPNFFKTSSNSIKKQLEKQPFIKKVKIKKNALLQMHIYIEEAKPLFIREDTNMIVFDTNTEAKNNIDKNLNIPYLINYVPNTKYEELIKKLKAIDYNLLKKISQIKYEPNKYDDDRFILYMNDSNRVYINLPKFKSFNDYDKMVTKFEGKTGKLFLDSGNYFEYDKK